ncbi:hypothetical protein BU607_08410 [Staphylococcus auricularis]|uniref:Putative HNH nuclease YajD n=2 Tax=Staphylococcus auricularis TaxID=29379 RepID=A0ABX5IEV2_9STAP|nr:hypothetical protein BU607_08410 [Staphylococcus auricularis]
MQLVVVYGAPNSGKTTYVQQHMEEQDIVYDYDILKEAITSKAQGFHTNAHQLLLNIRDAMIDYAKWNNTGTMYVITTFISKVIMRRIKQIDVETRYVRMDTPMQTCMERLRESDVEDKADQEQVIRDWYKRYGNQPASDRVVDKATMRFYKSKQWRDVREQVLKRDNYECQACKRQGKVTTIDRSKHKSLDVDHILELESHPELAYDMDNLETLCVSCHNKKHNRYQSKWKMKNENLKDEKW